MLRETESSSTKKYSQVVKGKEAPLLLVQEESSKLLLSPEPIILIARCSIIFEIKEWLRKAFLDY